MSEGHQQKNHIAIYAMNAEDAGEIDCDKMRRRMPRRMERIDRFRTESGKRLSMAAGFMMMSVLGLENEEELLFTEKGKPYAPGYPPFNVSHSGETAVMAVLEAEKSYSGDSGQTGSQEKPADPAQIPVMEGKDVISRLAAIPVDHVCSLGVDVEQIKERSLRVTKRAFTSDERAWLDESASDEEKMLRFYRIWTLKEAVMKADGRGLEMDPASFDVLQLGDGGILENNGHIWHAASWQTEGYMISVCWG